MENICSSSLFSWISSRNWSDNSLITLDWMTEKGWVGGHCHNNFHLWSEKLDWGGLVFCSAGSVLESQLSLEQKWLGSTLLFPPPEETVIFALWTQPSPKYPVHSRGVLCCYVTTFSNCTSCRAQTVLCATQTWWHFLLHVVAYQCLVRICTFQFDGFTFVAQLPSYLYLHPSDQKDSSKPLKQCTQAEAGWVFFCWRVLRAAVSTPDDFSVIHRAHFSQGPFFFFSFFVHVCVSTILHDSGFLIHKSILWIQDVEDGIVLKIACLQLCTEWWKSISWVNWNKYAGGLICHLKIICRIFKVFRTWRE